MVRIFTACLLAIVMANPLCCCADPLDLEATSQETAPRSCCAKNPAPADTRAPEAPDSSVCQCARTPRAFSAQGSVEAPTPGSQPVPPPWERASFFDSTDLWRPSACQRVIASKPPPPPGSPSLNILYGVFRC